MKISIIVATMNSDKTLQRCIDSIDAQNYQDRELIIIDGGSTDGTVDIIRANAKKIAHWESAPDRGIYHAWNKGVKHSIGEWVCFLGADDTFRENSTLKTVAPLLHGTIIYGDIDLVDATGRYIEKISRPWNRSWFNQGIMFPHVGALHHRSILSGFDESFRIAGDYEFMLRALKNQDPTYIPIAFCNMQIGGCSSKQLDATIRETQLALKKNNMPSYTSHLIKNRIKAFFFSLSGKVGGDAALSSVHNLWRVINRKPKLWS